MNESDLTLDTLLQETLALTEYLRVNNPPATPAAQLSTDDAQPSLFSDDSDDDYLYDLADSLLSDIPEEETPEFVPVMEASVEESFYPETPGIIYKIDNGHSTFCVRGFSATNIREAFLDLKDVTSSKRIILKLDREAILDSVEFFETKSFELAEVVREQIINRRFPHQEDAVCNISDPGFSWWMNIDSAAEEPQSPGRFEIFFRSHGINRADKYIQLGPIGDGGVAALRMNQARTLLRSSFPISEFSCDDKSFTVASSKPEHLGFISFKNIFLEGVNHTELENFPDNSVGRTLFYYFHELATVRKFWIEVKSKLG
ncbi:MAG: hypothetical protein ACXVLQ_00780 [Bacteriovorax sp.]